MHYKVTFKPIISSTIVKASSKTEARKLAWENFEDARDNEDGEETLIESVVEHDITTKS